MITSMFVVWWGERDEVKETWQRERGRQRERA